MPFQLKSSDRSVETGLRRIARGQLDEARDRLKADLAGDPASVHGLRKATKKLRGLLRLIRPVCPTARAETARLRDAARQIAGLRDAEVMLRTFETLEATLPADAIPPLRALLESRRQQATDPDALIAARRVFSDEIKAMRKRCGRWKIKGQEFDALRPGLTATWRRCRKGAKRARTALGDPGLPADAFHDWRKAVKQHWYQARLLLPIWPELMAPHVEQAGELGELLGDHNDLDVLLTTLESPRAPAAEPALAALREVVIARRRELAARSVALGSRLFAEPADALADRWERWWQLWRAQT
ncbi:CHAD domain-containing protein [Pararhodobacter sp. SW119]|uniref:CHAD domain-containing protein n=1 Tax=Pararhodobacter sp. SW119 TaxID=2780075 RepID=UPI001ADFDAE3|nr:CHAD domain-containing protein [Pararhodobacter sp. SW119]